MINIKNKKILIVDDDSTSRCILIKVLREAGYETEEASSGIEALKKAENEKPNLIVLDVNLPDITGYDVCNKLKSNINTKCIEILSISSYYTKNEDWVHGLECGADNYLIKPIDPHVLLAIVKSMLKTQETENKLKLALKATEEASDVKSQFLANI